MTTCLKRMMIGPMPPPLGGIAVYLDRLRKIQPEYEYIRENGMSALTWLYHCLRPHKVLAYHSPNIRRIISLLFVKALTGNRYCLFIHGGVLMDNYLTGGKLKRRLLKITVQQADSIYVLNRQAHCFFTRTMGVEAAKIVYFSSYLPPPPEREPAILGAYSQPTLAFVDSRSPLFIVNAARLTFFHGVDLYGIDMCIELLAKLIAAYPRAGLVVALAEIGDLPYYRRLQADIARHGLGDAVHFLTGNKEIWPLFKKADIMLRPTVTDGYSISLREAMQFGCRTVASDVCERPGSTIIFKARDKDAFYEAVITALVPEGR